MAKNSIVIYVSDTRVSGLIDEQKEKISKKLSEAMSCYYETHVEEYEKIKK